VASHLLVATLPVGHRLSKRLTNRVIDVVKALPLSEKRGTVIGIGIKGARNAKQ